MGKRDEQRTAARMVREHMERERRRKRTLWTSVIAVVLLAIGGMVGWGVYASQKQAQVRVPAGANPAGNAIVTGSGGVTVEDYVDFICPHCKTFHGETEQTLRQLLHENAITLVTHPVAYLDRFSTNRYSTRAAAASACAADGGRFNEFTAALFAAQPAEGSAGPTDNDLIRTGTDLGLDAAFAECVREKRYVTWAKKVSEDAARAGVTGTPTVLVNGKKVAANSASILAAVTAARSGAPSPAR